MLKSFSSITVFMGFLGAGKTTVILSLLRQLPPNMKTVLLKNEFGDTEVDSQLARESNLTAVNEIQNGCMCCVLVGQMKTAMLEIKEKYNPERIIIESSGSAFPATLALQIHDLEAEYPGFFKLDAIVTVVDAENFTGYEDTSPTARMQASYTDLILINKWEFVSERQLDIVMDHLYTLNELTPKIKCNGVNGVDPHLVFGIGTTFVTDRISTQTTTEPSHNSEVEVIQLSSFTDIQTHHDCDTLCDGISHIHNTVTISHASSLTYDNFTYALSLLSKEYVWRVKGFVQLQSSHTSYIVNWAFGRYELHPTNKVLNTRLQLTVVGENGYLKDALHEFVTYLGIVFV